MNHYKVGDVVKTRSYGLRALVIEAYADGTVDLDYRTSLDERRDIEHDVSPADIEPWRSPGRPKGTTKDDSKRGVVRFRCRMEDKARWVKRAQADGQTLTEWIVGGLNRL